MQDFPKDGKQERVAEARRSESDRRWLDESTNTAPAYTSWDNA